MRIQGKDWRGGMMPVMVAAIVAVVGQTAVLFSDFGAGNDPQGRGNARMITAAAVSRAGAIEIPSEPAAGRAVATEWTAANSSLPPGNAGERGLSQSVLDRGELEPVTRNVLVQKQDRQGEE